MAGLDELALALRAGQQGKADLAGMDEDYARATSDRDTMMTKADRYGQSSPLMALGDIIKNSRGRQQMRELKPQRVNARNAIAENASALPMYQAQQAENAVQYGQEQDTAKAGALVQAAALKAAAAKEQNLAANALTQQNIEKPLNVGKDTSLVDPTTGELIYQGVEGTTGAGGRYSNLTAGQLQTGLKEYRKQIQPIQNIVANVANLNNMLTGLPDANEDIPGIGYIEGGTGNIASLARAIGGEEGQNIHAAWTGTIAPLIRKQAGLAQTRTELERVEQAYGANWMSNEETFRTQYPLIMEAMKRDLKDIEGTTMPAVGQYYKDTMEKIGHPTVFDETYALKNPFEVKEGVV
jgi:hypothetical protein